MFRRNNQQFTKKDLLKAVPVRNAAIESRRNEKGEIELSIPRKTGGAMDFLSRIFFIPSKKRVALDKMGTFVWEQCDTRHTVKHIVRSMQEEFGFDYQHTEKALLIYLQKLVKRGIIGIAIDKKER